MSDGRDIRGEIDRIRQGRIRELTRELQAMREATQFDDAQHRRRAIDLLIRGSKFLHESWCDEVHQLLDDMRVSRESR